MRGTSKDDVASTEELEHVKIVDMLAEVFKDMGFTVLKDYDVTDINGLTHHVDLLLEGEVAPGVNIRVAFIIQARRVTLSDIEWYIAKKVVLPSVDKFVILALEGIDHDVSFTASRYGIQVIDIHDYLKLIKKGIVGIQPYIKIRLPKLPKVIIKPKLKCEDFIEIVSKELKPHIFSRRKCSDVAFTITYIPLLKVNARFTIEEIEKGNVLIKEVTIVFDGVKGYAIMPKSEGLGIDEAKGVLSDLPALAYELLTILSERGTIQLNELIAELGVDASKVKSIIDVLTLRSFIDVYGDIIELRYKFLDEFKDPLKHINRELLVKFENALPEDILKKAPFILVRTPIHKVIDLVKSMNGEVLDLSIVFYPIYVVFCIRDEHEERLLIYDGLSGTKNEELARIIDHPEVLDHITKALKPLSKSFCVELS